MPTVKEVYVALRTASEGTRDLDIMIAELIGWQRRTLKITDTATGRVKERPQWMPPESDSPSKVPQYTTDMDDSYFLARESANGSRIAFSWEKGSASAVVGSTSHISEAPTLSLALCVASVLKIATDQASSEKTMDLSA
ncbi:hypothetical protein [Rhizobium sp. NFR12]|uniref:hypothetical protein n=1 Tax=Rhizobium sp. NFR12 TaxID=1566261 RepID=UPI0008A7BF97|nr:hypothetical protein [Rhizobium sp. NFR12]SEH27930.1 hypothetical protein SAMN03159407_3387 [Rhizobium sp. NFR12]